MVDVLARFLHKSAANGDGARTDGTEDEQPLRAELFSVSQLEQHAKALAGWHDVGDAAASARARIACCRGCGPTSGCCGTRTTSSPTAVKRGRRITPAAEWFLDNYHLIEEQIRTARRHLPRGYSRELPRLASGPSAGHPRVYDIALELISHADGRVDGESLRAFVAAYQSVRPLRLGELWAIPIMLRLALLENLRRVAVHVMTAPARAGAGGVLGRADARGVGEGAGARWCSCWRTWCGRTRRSPTRSSPSSRAACRGRARPWCSPSRGSSSGSPSRGRRSSTCSSRRARARPPTRSRSATASAACASSARPTGATSSRR